MGSCTRWTRGMENKIQMWDKVEYLMLRNQLFNFSSYGVLLLSGSMIVTWLTNVVRFSLSFPILLILAFQYLGFASFCLLFLIKKLLVFIRFSYQCYSFVISGFPERYCQSSRSIYGYRVQAYWSRWFSKFIFLWITF